MKSKSTIICATLLIFSASFGKAESQSFGLSMGQPLEELEVVEELGSFSYIINPPRTASGFDIYVAFVTPQNGVCMVRAISEYFERDGYGIAVRNRFNELKEILDENYGQGELFDGLRSGALWEDNNDWVMAIRQNERYYQAEWDIEDRGDIEGIIMAVDALSSSTSVISLQYKFPNYQDCEVEAAQADASAL